VTSLWADAQVYYPLEVEPYTPESYFAKGRNDPAFRTKLKIALQLVEQVEVFVARILSPLLYSDNCTTGLRSSR
jgi:hypothetical protein